MGSNKKLGCAGCFSIGLLIFCCIGVIGAGTLTFINNSELYQIAVESAQENPRARDVLGTPIEGGWVVTQFSIEGGTESSTGLIEVPVSGPKASGVVHLAASSRNGGDWTIDLVELEVNGERFSLGK